jgi:hypothetical protein
MSNGEDENLKTILLLPQVGVWWIENELHHIQSKIKGHIVEKKCSQMVAWVKNLNFATIICNWIFIANHTHN